MLLCEVLWENGAIKKGLSQIDFFAHPFVTSKQKTPSTFDKHLQKLDTFGGAYHWQQRRSSFFISIFWGYR